VSHYESSHFWSEILDFDFDVSSVTSVSEGVMGQSILIGSLVVIVFVSRMLFVIFAPSIMALNPLRGFSGVGLIGVAVAIFIGGLFLTGKQDHAVRVVQRNIMDPFTVSVLKRDSCDIASGAYCVVVFEGAREISVNWFDHRVYMWDIINPPSGAIWDARRPVSRNERRRSKADPVTAVRAANT